MSELRDKTISGLFWSFLQKVGGRGIELIITILLARVLTPKDFGLIGMLAIFIALSQTLVQSGFKQALIQKKDPDEEDYASVFYINLVISIIIYTVLFFAAPFISKFYGQPILTKMTRVLSLLFIIDAFSYIQEARLTKYLEFKKLMYVHLPSTIFSGIVAIYMAYKGYGVWSIIGQRLIMRFAFAVQIWIHSKWKPLWVFSWVKVKRLFSFGGNLMISGILQTIFQNIYQVIIGKFFPINQLGYYQNANSLSRPVVTTVSSVLSSVTFPIFATIQHDNQKLKGGLKRSVQQVLFWLIPILILGIILAKPLFSFVLTDKWLPAVPFFRILCIVGLFRPLNAYNLNVVNAKGRSDIVLKLNIVKKLIEALGIIITASISIWALVWFQALLSIVKFLMNSYWCGRLIDYPLKKQLLDIMPIVVLGILVGLILLVFIYFFNYWSDWILLLFGILFFAGLYWFFARVLKIEPYYEFVEIIRAKYKELFK